MVAFEVALIQRNALALVKLCRKFMEVVFLTVFFSSVFSGFSKDLLELVVSFSKVNEFFDDWRKTRNQSLVIGSNLQVASRNVSKFILVDADHVSHITLSIEIDQRL